MPETRPNVLLITSHDIGRHLGCYGVPTVHTPALDRLAAEGVRFQNAFCTSPFCSPSRASIFTGRYPHSTGVNGLTHGGFGWDMNDDERHLAHHLTAAGYQCEQFGTLHETHRPATDWGYAAHHIDPQGTARDIAEIACRRITECGPPGTSTTAGGSRPWYFHLGFFEPHTPFDWGGAVPDDSLGITIPPWLVDNAAARAKFAAFQGAIRNLDEGVHRVLETLRETGQAANTLVLFTADHGIPFSRAKGSLYDAGLEVALLLRLPGRGWSGGRVYNELISHVDHTPTILDLLGIDRPARVQGRSYRPLLDDEPFDRNAQIYGELTFFNAPFFSPRRSIRTERHLLIVNMTTDKPYYYADGILPIPEVTEPWDRLGPHGQSPPVELFDLANDPLQLRNLFDDPKHAQTAKDLKARLLDRMRQTDDPLLQGIPVPPCQRRALRLLGFEGN
ncbi:MAG: sulfatase [Phycisphaerae bacterium]